MTIGLGVGLPAGLGLGLAFGLTVGLSIGLTVGLVVGMVGGLRNGGASYLRHRVLRMLLRSDKLIPDDLLGFLDYADSRILLRRAGGGYLFVHRLLQDHFANKDAQATSGQVPS